MNKQDTTIVDGAKIRAGIEWTHYFGPGTGYTWNAIRGCKHECAWTMPDGKIAVCYAGETARGVARQFYPNGFEAHYFDPQKLDDPIRHKQPAGIFLDSMSDLMGANVPEPEIWRVLDVAAKCPQHVFFLLTKNAPRLEQFEFPSNVWVGVSMPPSFMKGKALSRDQQLRYLERAYTALDSVKGGGPTWLSIESLSWDVAPNLTNAPIDWAVIGAASNGNAIYQPEPQWVTNALLVLDARDIKVFFKGNIRGNPAIREWREEYPPYILA